MSSEGFKRGDVVRARGGPRRGETGTVVRVVHMADVSPPHDEALVSFADGTADYFDAGQLGPADEPGGGTKKRRGGG